MVRARSRLAASARSIQPLKQGDLDGLCGLYSILNAIRVAVFPRKLRRAELIALAQPGLRILSRTRRLSVIIHDGMHPGIWENMAGAVLDEAETKLKRRIKLTNLLGSGQGKSDWVRALRRSMHDGRPVVLLLTRRLEHWTVATGYTRSRLTLFDSSGHRWISWSKLGLECSDDDRPHALLRAYVLQVLD